MDEYSTKILQYGHVGKSVYRRETQSWAFLRSIVPQPRISYTGVTRTVVRSPSTLVERPSTFKRSTLSWGFPELIGGYGLAHNEKLSHTVTALSETCSPLISALLDFGRAVDLDIDTSGRRAVSIVAFASGECGNTISFRIITDDTVGLEHPANIQLRVPTIGDDDGTEWLSDGTPIRQICFSHAIEDRATFLAVRFSSTVVFRPLYRRAPTSVSTHRGNNAMAPQQYQISRLDPNFLLEISISHTGGLAHADVKFNPWNQNKLAIVDKDGNWSIWELRSQHRRNKDNWEAMCMTSGTLPWVGTEEGQNKGTGGRHDGWLAIEWAVNEDYVIVCDRRCSMLYQMNGDRVYSYSVELGLKSKSEWILDIKRSAHNPSHVFILTTFRLIWFDITLDSISVHQDTRPSLPPRLSWRHFRDADDITLQLSSLAVDNDFYLVLFSRLNHFVLAFYCSEPEVVSDSASAADPFTLYVPPTSDIANNFAPPVGAHFSTLVFRQAVPTTTGEQYFDRGLRFIKAFTVYSNLRVEESLYSKISTGSFVDERPSAQNSIRARQLRLLGLRRKIPNAWSDFVIDDWDESPPDIVPISGNRTESIVPLAEPRFTFDYTHIYAIATEPLDLLSQDGEGTIEVGLQELVNKATDHVSSTSRTALETLRRSLVIDDIDQDAQALNAFISQFVSKHSAIGEKSHLLVQPIDYISSELRPQATLAAGPKLDLVAIYDRLVNHWLIDLPFDIPGRTRITKEKTIRHFVADIVLSQILLPQKSTTIEPTRSNVEVPSTDFPRGAANSLGPASEQCSYGALARSIGQSFQSQAETTATQESSLQVDLKFPELKADEWPSFKALSPYTTLNRTEPISQDVEPILDCWKPGTDPASYSLTFQKSQLPTGASGRKSRKKVSQASKNMSLDSVAPPAVSSTVPVAKRDWGSQPDHAQSSEIRLQSSQVTDDLPMTQVEPGAFGGREASKKSNVKARKKKRAAGF